MCLDICTHWFIFISSRARSSYKDKVIWRTARRPWLLCVSYRLCTSCGQADFVYSIPVKSFPITSCVNPSAGGILPPWGYLNGSSSCEKLHTGKWQEIWQRKGSDIWQRLETSFTFVDVEIHSCPGPRRWFNVLSRSFSPASSQVVCLPAL